MFCDLMGVYSIYSLMSFNSDSDQKFFNSANSDSDQMDKKKPLGFKCLGAFFRKGAWDAPYAC